LRVGVNFYGFVRDVIGTPSIELEVPNHSSLKDLFELLSAKFGPKLRDRLLNGAGELEANVQVFVGDTQAISLDEPLGEGERPSAEVKVFVLSATAGG
jgi:molybdopterin converting factor small subunit